MEQIQTRKQTKFFMFFTNILLSLKQDFKTEHNDFKNIAIKSGVLALEIFISLIWSYFVFAVVVTAAIFICLEKSSRRLYYMVFLLPFLNVIRLKSSELYYSVYLWVLVLAILGVQLLIDLIKKRKKINLFFTIMCGVLAVYFALPIGPYNFTNFGAIYLSLAIIYICYCYAKDFSFKELILIFALGIVCSSVFGLFRPLFPRAQEIIPIFQEAIQRFTGVANDPNYYSGDLLVVLSGFLILFAFNKINYLIYPVMLFFTIFCIRSNSKMMFITYAILMAVFCIAHLIKYRNKKSFLQVCALFICFIISCGIDYPYTRNIYYRFLESDSSYVRTESTIPVETEREPDETESNNMETKKNKNGSANTNIEYINYVFRNNKFTVLTTGRTNIWLAYLDASTDSAKHLLFGYGIGANYLLCDNGYRIDNWSEHNTYIQTLYRVGIVGYLLIALTIISAIDRKKFKQMRFANLYIIGTIALLFIALNNLLSYRFAIYVLIASMSLVERVSEKDKENVLVAKDKK